MKNLFNSVKSQRPKSNMFDLSHDVKFSFNMGKLVPVCVMECVPGDKVHLSCTSLLRFAPLIAPVMHRMDSTVHYFFVPNRLLWPNWENYITGTPNPITNLPYVCPFADLRNTVEYAPQGGLADYMGIPPFNAALDPLLEVKISCFAMAAYQKIYDDFYRDQNLVPSSWKPLADGDNSADFSSVDGVFAALRTRAWRHDYFTASLPFAQKGAPVSIPLGDVTLNPAMVGTPGLIRPAATYGEAGAAGAPLELGAPAGDPLGDSLYIGDPFDGQGVYDPNGTLEVGATTISDLRRAFRLQEWLEKNARGGTRYIEHVLNHFGVRSSDKRMQRAEYITGTKSPVIISEIVNTTGTADLPQGNMSGHGLTAQQGKVGKYFCEEHGYIIGIMSVMPQTAYQQGIPKHFLKTTDQFDFFYPSFAHIGEQEVFNNEIYSWQTAPDQAGTFGYVPRYAEYKYMPSRVAGDFRTSLAFWHLGRIFDSPPVLNQSFIECVPRNDIFAVTEEDTDHLYCHFLNQIKAIRPMPKFGTPYGV